MLDYGGLVARASLAKAALAVARKLWVALAVARKLLWRWLLRDGLLRDGLWVAVALRQSRLTVLVVET